MAVDINAIKRLGFAKLVRMDFTVLQHVAIHVVQIANLVRIQHTANTVRRDDMVTFASKYVRITVMFASTPRFACIVKLVTLARCVTLSVLTTACLV